MGRSIGLAARAALAGGMAAAAAERLADALMAASIAGGYSIHRSEAWAWLS